MLKCKEFFSRFLHDGLICLTNNVAERALRGVALCSKTRLFAGVDRAAAIDTLMITAKLNGANPRAWLADVLRRIADCLLSHHDEVLPRNWARHDSAAAA